MCFLEKRLKFRVYNIRYVCRGGQEQSIRYIMGVEIEHHVHYAPFDQLGIRKVLTVNYFHCNSYSQEPFK